MNFLLTVLFLSINIFFIVSIIMVYHYIKLIFYINKNKEKLNLQKNIKEKLGEYWGLNILRQNHDVWDEIGNKLSDEKLFALWKKVDQYYKALKKILVVDLIIVIISVIIIFIKRN